MTVPSLRKTSSCVFNCLHPILCLIGRWWKRIPLHSHPILALWPQKAPSGAAFKYDKWRLHSSATFEGVFALGQPCGTECDIVRQQMQLLNRDTASVKPMTDGSRVYLQAAEDRPFQADLSPVRPSKVSFNQTKQGWCERDLIHNVKAAIFLSSIFRETVNIHKPRAVKGSYSQTRCSGNFVALGVRSGRVLWKHSGCSALVVEIIWLSPCKSEDKGFCWLPRLCSLRLYMSLLLRPTVNQCRKTFSRPFILHQAPLSFHGAEPNRCSFRALKSAGSMNQRTMKRKSV